MPTIFSDPPPEVKEKFYDQIAWFARANGVPKLSIPYCRGGFVDFLPFVYTSTNLSKSSKSFRICDHYPLWTEFDLGRE